MKAADKSLGRLPAGSNAVEYPPTEFYMGSPPVVGGILSSLPSGRSPEQGYIMWKNAPSFVQIGNQIINANHITEITHYPNDEEGPAVGATLTHGFVAFHGDAGEAFWAWAQRQAEVLAPEEEETNAVQDD